MARFTIERHSALSAAEAWRRLTDWERHALPGTTIIRSGEGLGSSFTARTALGPLGFDDPMDVVAWQPPDPVTAGYCRIEKRGRVVTGWAELTVAATPDGSHVRWHEEASIRHTGKILDVPTRLAATRVFGRLVDRLLGNE